MPKKKRLQFKFIPFALGAALIGLIILIFLVASSEQSFPLLPSGAYAGRISGMSGQEKEFATLYVERLKSSKAMLFVVLKQGWKPQIVATTRLSKTEETSNSFALEPIRISNGAEVYTLHGTRGRNDYSGKVISEKGTHGVWSLQPVSDKSLRASPLKLDPNFNLEQWLRLKGKYHLLAGEYKELKQRLEQNQNKLEKLSGFVKEERALRLRARSRRDQLSQRVKEISEIEGERDKELKKAVRELEQLTRITRQGIAVELTRRVAKRENKWYFVHWQYGTDLSAMEEALAERLDVDLTKLKTSVKRANEIQKLKATIALEKARVIKLQKIYREKIEGHRKPSPTPKDRKYKRPWWERWDTIFG